MWKLANIISIPKPFKDTGMGAFFHISQQTTQTPNQHGYKVQHPTVTTIYTLNNTVAKGFNKIALPARTITVSLGTSKSFDTVNIHILVVKLLQISTPCTVIKFTAKYIKGRKAYTNFRNHKSMQYQIKAGVPQGGVLSPTIFNTYTPDILTPTAPVQVMLCANNITITSTYTSMSAARKYIQSSFRAGHHITIS